MINDKKFEEYMRNVICNSISFKNPLTEKEDNSKYYFDNLKVKLLNQYSNKSLNDIKGSKVIDTQYGETLKIVNKQKIDFELVENNFYNQMNHNLKLLPKIGVKTEQKLKKQGFNTIESLLGHDNYHLRAKNFLDNLKNLSFSEIMNLLNNNKYEKKCGDNLIKCLSLIDHENFKFMDIETVGLSNVPIILIGVAEIKSNKIISSQYFSRDFTEEASILEAYFNHLNDESVHVTFNGKTFDVPFIKNRTFVNDLNKNLDLPHVDLMYFAKHLWKDDLPNCQLQTIEKYKFGIERIDDVPGQFIPDYYKTYLDEKNIGPIVPIIEHNCQDIVSLASFLEKMYEEVN